MGNKLAVARDSFAKIHPEQRLQLNTREWGLVHIKGNGPTLLIFAWVTEKFQTVAQLTCEILNISYVESVARV